MASTSAGPWSVKGVDPRSREIAKDLARRSGMTLGEWLNRFIADSGETDAAGPHNLEATGGRTAAPADRAELRKIVEALQAFSVRLDRSEAEAGAALKTIRQSYAELEGRLSSAETRLSDTDAGAVERRFEALAEALHAKVEAGRAEIAETLREAAAGQFEKVEGALRDLSGHVEQTERRSHRAIERLGEEMMRVATLLNSRVASAESRSADAVERASGEIAKVAVTVEGRMGEAEAVQAAALERLGSEISRIAERLADRIAGSERRSAAAIDDIGLQVVQAADRIDQRYDRANDEVASRLRESEERTARLLAEARDRLHLAQPSLIEDRPALAAVEAPAHVEPQTAPAVMAEPEPIRAQAAAKTASTAVFSDLFSTPAEPEPAPAFEPIHDFGGASDPFGPLPPLEPLTSFSDASHFDATPLESHTEAVFEPEPLAAAAPVPPMDLASESHAYEPMAEVAQAAAAPVAGPERPKTTRELLESARAAARLAAAGPAKPESSLAKRFNLTLPAGLTMPSGLSLPSLPKLKKKDAGLTLRTAVVASGTAAAICVTAVGAAKVYGGGEGPKPAYAKAVGRTDLAALAPTAARRGAYRLNSASPAAPTAARTGADNSLAAVALSTPLAAKAATSKLSTPGELYADGARRIESGDRAGLAEVLRAAVKGAPGAQLYLAKLYEQGTGGVRKDMGQARRWTARAAQAGDVKAMHNLGLYYFQGEGGEQNTAAAADWFKRAAELGLQDSQYNLARLYQQGVGVGQNGAEAYKWYLVAAANGDAGARNDALAIRKTLGSDEAAAAERSAALIQQQARAPSGETAPQ